MTSQTLPSAVKVPATQPAEDLAHQFMNEAEALARREPATVVAAALGAGLVLNLVPTRFLVSSVAAVTMTLLRPALLTLGVIKAFELCSIKNHTPDQS